MPATDIRDLLPTFDPPRRVVVAKTKDWEWAYGLLQNQLIKIDDSGNDGYNEWHILSLTDKAREFLYSRTRRQRPPPPPAESED